MLEAMCKREGRWSDKSRCTFEYFRLGFVCVGMGVCVVCQTAFECSCVRSCAWVFASVGD